MVRTLILLILCTASGGDLGGPCDSSGQCNDVNAACVVGSCVCTGDNFQRNNTCGTCDDVDDIVVNPSSCKVRILLHVC